MKRRSVTIRGAITTRARAGKGRGLRLPLFLRLDVDRCADLYDTWHMELYSVSNYKTAERRVYPSLGMAVIAARSLRKRDGGFWTVSRVSDAAFYTLETKTFGPRVYHRDGDALRLRDAAALLKWQETVANCGAKLAAMEGGR